jgi:predicted dehydrogenase
MHYPTHSMGGFISVTGGHVTELAALGHIDPDDDWHRVNTVHRNPFGNETALMRLSGGAMAVIREHRRVGAEGHEGFSLYGTKGSLVDSFGLVRWVDKSRVGPALTPEEMRDPLPPEVAKAWTDERGETQYGGHGGSHAYLVHEFVSAVARKRQPAVNAWTAARMFIPGIIAHKSAMKGGVLMKVPDLGDPPA